MAPAERARPGHELPGREPLLWSFVGAVLLAFPIGALLGALEAAKLLVQGHARYASDGFELVALATGSSAALAAVLALPSALVARILWGRVERRVAPPSACAGLGAALGVAGFVASDAIGFTLLLPAALAATCFVVLLRELCGWWPLVTRAPLWSTLALVAVLGACGLAWRAPSGWSDAPLAQDAQGRTKRPNVVLLSIDTLRADRLGAYGGPVATPALDALAADGVLFEQAISQANITGPSHATMLTGLLPAEHGVLANAQPLPNRTRTWIDELGANGFETAGFVSGFTLVDTAIGLAERFDHYDDHLLVWRWMPEVCTRLRLVKDVIRWLNVKNPRGKRPQRADRPAAETIDAVETWLAERDAARPFALFVHFYDPHVPYAPPEEFARRYDPDWSGDSAADWYAFDTAERKEWANDPRKYEHMLALHHGEIGYADSQAGRFFELLRARGEFDETLVIVTSDHGEELGEHDIFFDHGATLYDTELHVPLIVKWPKSRGIAPARIATQVRLLDIAPTVLDVAGVKPSSTLSGANLAELVGNDSAPTASADRPAYSFSDLPGNASGYEFDARAISLRHGGFKLIWNSELWLDCERREESWQLFDLAKDAREVQNLLASEPAPIDEHLQKMREALQSWIELTQDQEGPRELSEAAREGLKATGYF
ncbi:MAG: sulfatase [Planctomycetes bacterium]|nr:sulfatase [Planctomycetota bacterium]